jgi:hypothetical protein
MQARIARRAYIPLLLAVPAVAVAGCGGNNDSASKSAAATGASGQQGTTGPQTGATGTKRARTKQRPARNRERDRGESRSSAPVSPLPPPPSTPSRGAAPAPTAAPSLTPEQLEEIKPHLKQQARLFCKSSTLTGLAQFYKIDSGDPDAVARAYAAPYPVELRKTMATGCKAGLLESK